MNAFLTRNRLIVLAYAGMVVLLVVTALFSPGFLSVSNMRSTCGLGVADCVRRRRLNAPTTSA